MGEVDYKAAFDRLEKKFNEQIETVRKIISEANERIIKLEQELTYKLTIKDKDIDTLKIELEKINKDLDEGEKEFKILNGMLTELGEIMNSIRKDTEKVTDITIDLTRKDEKIKQLEKEMDKHKELHEKLEKAAYEKGKDNFSRVISLISLFITVVTIIVSVAVTVIKK